MIKTCLNCGKEFEIPPCRDWREHCCSSLCKKEFRHKKVDELRDQRTRHCFVCSKKFVVKKSQIDSDSGFYCSQKCNGVARLGAKTSDETKKKMSDGQYRAMAEGRLVHHCGVAHARWKGGPKAMVQRRIASGQARESVQKYRKQNPETVREWAINRASRKVGRLPKGTVKSLMVRQRGKCAICAQPIREKFHVDHIMPLALGGKHEAANIQLLCPSCNVRKSAKDPIRYMQEIGRLL